MLSKNGTFRKRGSTFPNSAAKTGGFYLSRLQFRACSAGTMQEHAVRLTHTEHSRVRATFREEADVLDFTKIREVR